MCTLRVITIDERTLLVAKNKHASRRGSIPIAVIDRIDLVKREARELEDALLFANAAVRSTPEETGEYLEGELAALALSAQRLRADADELRIAATPFMPKPRKRCRVSA